jgi:hypothetical protein
MTGSVWSGKLVKEEGAEQAIAIKMLKDGVLHVLNYVIMRGAFNQDHVISQPLETNKRPSSYRKLLSWHNLSIRILVGVCFHDCRLP